MRVHSVETVSRIITDEFKYVRLWVQANGWPVSAEAKGL